MADRMACEIWIGGTISNALAEELCGLICDTGSSLGWGEAAYKPSTVKDLSLASEGGVLHLYDDERTWGEFEDLEEFLRENKIPYDRQTASKYEYDAEQAIYRPASGLEVTPTTGSGNPVVEVASLQPVIDSIDLLYHHLNSPGGIKVSVSRWVERLQRLLRSKLPREMPLLEPFTITE